MLYNRIQYHSLNLLQASTCGRQPSLGFDTWKRTLILNNDLRCSTREERTWKRTFILNNDLRTREERPKREFRDLMGIFYNLGIIAGGLQICHYLGMRMSFRA